MTDDASTGARAEALAWAAALVEASPWAEASGRATLLLASPPRAKWLTPDLAERARPVAWLLLDASDVRLLPPEQRTPLLRHGVFLEQQARGDLAVFVAEAAQAFLEGVSRRALEARWLVAHADAAHDPLRRLEELERAAHALPRDSEERVLRPLYVQFAGSLGDLGTGGLPAAGEAAAALCRLLCVLEDGVHPPADWLVHEARSTALGQRFATWIEDLTRAIGGDAAAHTRALAARESLLRNLAEPIRQRVGAPDWLTEPGAYALRPPR